MTTGAARLAGHPSAERVTRLEGSVRLDGNHMTNADDAPDLEEEVMDTREHSHPNRREHAKADPRPDEELERRTEIERSEIGLPEDPEN